MYWMSDQDLTEETSAVVLGDVVQRRSPLIAHEVVAGLAITKEHMHSRFKHSIVLAGNHDFPQDKATRLSAALHLSGGSIEYYSIPGPLWVNKKLAVCVLPWGKYTPEELRAEVAKMLRWTKDSEHKILFTHFPTKEAVSENGQSGFGKYSVQDFLPDQWDLIVSGDIHTHQTIGKNFVYCGAPYQLTRSDMGDENKGYLVIYDDMSWEHRKLKGPRHVAPVVNGPVDFSKFDRNDMATIHVKRGTVSIDEVREKAKAYFHLPPVVTWLDEAGSKKDKVKALKSGVCPDNPVSVLEAYLETRYTGKLDREILMDCGKTLLRKAGESEEAYTGVVTFERIVAKNFMAFGELDVPLESQGIVLVDGRNENEQGVFSANAVGKSSLLEAVHYGLFGETVRGLSATELVNRDTGQDWFLVELHLRTSRHKVRILRTRNHRDFGSGVQLFLDDIHYSSEGRKKAESTENQIWREVGISPKLFRSAVMFGQNVKSMFAAGTDKDRKEILSELFAIDAYVRAEELAGVEVDRLVVSLGDLRKQLDSAKAEKAVKESTLTQAQEQAKAAQSGREARLVELQTLVSTVAQQLEEAELKVGSPPVPPRQVERLDTTKLEELQAKRVDLTLQLGTLKNKQETMKLQEIHWANLLKEGTCPTCGNEITKEGCDHVLGMVRQDLSLALVQSEPVWEELEKCKQSISEEQIKISGYANEEQRRFATESLAYNKALVQYHTDSAAVASLKTRVESLLNEAEKLQEEKDPFFDMIEILKMEIWELSVRIEEQSLAMAEMESEIPYWETSKTLFGKQGLRTFVFDCYSEEIEKQANDALDILSDGIFRVEMGAKKGITTIKESFGLTVFKRGKEVPYLSLSGAERRFIDLSLMWALFTMLGRVNLLVEDEVFDVLDASAAPRVLDLLKKASDERNCTVFCITHKIDIKPLCENVWTVVMSGSSARILLESTV